MPRRWRGRGSQKYAQALFLVFTVLLFYQAISKSDRISTNGRTAAPDSPPKDPGSILDRQAQFWRALYSHVLNNDPQCAPPEILGIPHKLDTMYTPDHDIPRPDILWLKPQDVQQIKSAHASFLHDVYQKPLQLPYQIGTKGIAVTASYQLLPVLAISLRMLRRTGSTLPVEVFLATPDDYDASVCDHIFPSLNAKCLIFQTIVHAAGTGVALTRFQYKIMALLFSSFETVLLLDSDAFPLTDPTYLFTSTPLTTHGLILWPDFWYPSESPYFFEIASIHPTPPLNARPATESGELLVHKPQHNTTLLLAAYYNYYGPDLYYPLHSQGAPGQGDKETFGWAAAATNSSFYIVHQPVVALGRSDSSGQFFGSAMAQHDPVADYELHHHRISKTTDDIHPQQQPGEVEDEEDGIFPPPQPAPLPTDTSSSPPPTSPSASPPPLFIHANFPKFDPAVLFRHPAAAAQRQPAVFDSNGSGVRPWGATPLRLGPSLSSEGEDEGGGGDGKGGGDGDVDADGDIEKVFWEEIARVACEWQGEFGAWREVRAGEGMDFCKVVRRWMGEVFGVTEGGEDGKDVLREERVVDDEEPVVGEEETR